MRGVFFISVMLRFSPRHTSGGCLRVSEVSRLCIPRTRYLARRGDISSPRYSRSISTNFATSGKLCMSGFAYPTRRSTSSLVRRRVWISSPQTNTIVLNPEDSMSLEFNILIIGKPQKIIRTHFVKFAKFNQMMYWQFICPSFISCVHSLRSANYICYLLLCFIVIFSQISHSFYIYHAFILNSKLTI